MIAAIRLRGWRRDSDDPDDRIHLETVRARLARMKVHRAKRQVEELRNQWPEGDNVLEAVLIRRNLNSEDAGDVG